MKEISVIFTCYNRRKKTVAAMQSLVNGNKNIHFHFIIVDDMSTDDTINAIKNLKYDTTIISGTGNLYWCGGMRKGIQFFLDSDDTNDCMLINDDVSFFDNAVVQLVALLDTWKDAVIVGATCDKTGKFTYGLRKKGAIGVRLERIEPNEKGIEGDTMNANCVLLPNHILREVGNIDSYYTHSLGDYDLGFQIRKIS